MWAALAARHDHLDGLSIVLGLAAVAAGLGVAHVQQRVGVSASFLVYILAGAFLGPASAFCAAAISEIAATGVTRTRRHAFLFNMVAAGFAALLAGTLMQALVPHDRSAGFYLVIGALALGAFVLTWVIIAALNVAYDGYSAIWSPRMLVDYAPSALINVGLIVAGAAIYVEIGLAGHPGTLVAVDFSSDGQTVATAGGNTVCLWDETGKTSHILRGHSNAVHTIAFSPDGKTLASGGYDGKVFLWETATGKVRARFHGHRGWVQSVYFSPDGRLLVSAGAFHDAKRQVEEETYLWDVTGRYQDGRLKEARFSSSELSGLWSDLAGEDAAMAYRAVWALVAAPQQSIALLRARLIPADDKQIVRWIAELDSEEFKVREQAHKALEKQGETAEFALRQHFEKRPPSKSAVGYANCWRNKPTLPSRRRLCKSCGRSKCWSISARRKHGGCSPRCPKERRTLG